MNISDFSSVIDWLKLWRYFQPILGHFGIENYAWKLAMVQNVREYCRFFLYYFLGPNYANTSNSHTTYIILLKFCQNLCLLRCLKFNLKLVSNFTPSISTIAKTEFSLGLVKLRALLDLRLSTESTFLISSPSLLHALAKLEKKKCFKWFSSQKKIFIFFWIEDRVK